MKRIMGLNTKIKAKIEIETTPADDWITGIKIEGVVYPNQDAPIHDVAISISDDVDEGDFNVRQFRIRESIRKFIKDEIMSQFSNKWRYWKFGSVQELKE